MSSVYLLLCKRLDVDRVSNKNTILQRITTVMSKYEYKSLRSENTHVILTICHVLLINDSNDNVFFDICKECQQDVEQKCSFFLSETIRQTDHILQSLNLLNSSAKNYCLFNITCSLYPIKIVHKTDLFLNLECIKK